MNINKMALAAICSGILVVSGCDSEKASEEPKVTDSTSSENEEVELKIDWDSVIEETKEELTNPEYFDYVKDLYIKVDESEKKITFTAALDDATNDDIALDFADTLLRRFNATAQLQDNSIKGGSNDYLGGIYDEYSVSIGIAPLSKTDDKKSWYIYDSINKGVQRSPKLQNK